MDFIEEIKLIIDAGRQKTYQSINYAMVESYWLIGKRIVEEEQNGMERASYGKEILKNLSSELSKEYGQGFSERSLRNFRQFYLVFGNKEKWHTVCAKLSWLHLRLLLKIEREIEILKIQFEK